jgi:hypothetical protein
MRKIGAVIIALLIIAIVYLNIRAIEEPTSKKLLVQQTLYAITTDDSQIQVPLYVNQKTVLTSVEAIDTVYIHNIDESLKLKATTVDIQAGGKKSYLNETYLSYYFKLGLPKLEMDLYMKEAYLTITLKNEERYTVAIGRLSIFHAVTDDQIDILTQFGTNEKADYRLSSITLDIKANSPVMITNVFYTVNQFVQINQSITNRQEVVVLIPTDVFLYKETALKIQYEMDGITYEKTFNLFRYFDRVTRTLDDEHINRIYVIN